MKLTEKDIEILCEAFEFDRELNNRIDETGDTLLQAYLSESVVQEFITLRMLVVISSGEYTEFQEEKYCDIVGDMIVGKPGVEAFKYWLSNTFK